MLYDLATDLRAYDYDVYMPGRVHFPSRTVVARLPDGGLWLHSPGPVDDALAAQIDAWGPVRALVAPSMLHHLFLGDAARRWPQAQTWAPTGLAVKRPDLRLDHPLEQAASAGWAGTLRPTAIDGAPEVGETVFLHAPTGSLICTDLFFNLHRWNTPQTGVVLWMVGCRAQLGSSRAWRLWVKDRAAYRGSLERVLDQDFTRLVPSHGDVVEPTGPGALRAVLAWGLGG